MKTRRLHSIVPALALVLLSSAVSPGADPPAPPNAAQRIAGLEKMLAASPDNPGLMYRLAVVEAGIGRHADAIRWLEKAAARGYAFDPKEPAFAPLKKFEPYLELSRRLTKPPVRTSALAFRIAEPDLIPEGIAWDAAGKTFYVGSLFKKKILRIAPDGAARDFVASGASGLWTVLGMTVDDKRRILWVNSVADGREGEGSGSSGLFAFDLAKGSLIEKHVREGRPDKHLFNDVAVTPAGDVYLTDSESGGIWRLPRGAAALEVFLPGGTFNYPNGLTLDADGRRLYVADFDRGISLVDLETKKVRPVRHPRDVTISEIDGLYFFQGSLVAVQNGPGFERIAQFPLDRSGERVESVRVIESANPDFDIPTTGAIAGNEFFYMANTQLNRLEPDGKISPGKPLRDVLIFKAPLR